MQLNLLQNTLTLPCMHCAVIQPTHQTLPLHCACCLVFVLTSPNPIEYSGIHRKLPEPDVKAFRAKYAETSSGNWAHLHAQHADILARGADKHADKLCAVTALEVEKKKKKGGSAFWF